MVTALYRRYRPESFSEMIGQSQVTDPLMTALRTGRVGHAYLFSGPRGCGKTTSARILARCLNCVEGPTDTPCGVCPSCVELSRDGGGSLDVIEIDAASHGGVDDARDLRERAIFAPARDRFKIFIIDEAHMVTKEGFNALLKIVEEPPEHVKFVFATTEPDKVIGTIRSRTHHYPFRLIPPAALLEYVQTLCESEGVGVASGVLPLVVRAGGGSARDTLSILDQLIAGSEDDQVDYERAVGLLGFTHEDLLDEAVGAFAAHDAAAAFGAVDRVVQTGQDPQRFVEDLLERFRDLIVIGATNVDGAAAVFRGVPEDQLRRMFEQSQQFSHGDLSRIADTIAAGLDRMRGATAPRLHLELMVARALVAAQTAPAVAAAPAAGASAAPTGRPASMARPSAGVPAVAQDRGGAPTAPTSAGQAAAVSAMPVDAVAVEAAPVEAVPVEAVPSNSEPVRLASVLPSAPAAAEPVTFASAAAAARAMLSEPATPPQAIPPVATPPAAANPERTASEPGSTVAAAASVEPAESVEHAGPTVHAGPAADVASATPASAPTVPDAEAPVAEATAPAGTIEQIRDAWPQILQRLLDGNRNAWLASRAVNPLALLDGGQLGIAFESQTELDVFLSGDTQPALAAAIEAETGIAVGRYFPRPSRTGDLPRPSAELEQAAPTSAVEPASSSQTDSAAPTDTAAPTDAAAAAAPAATPAPAAPSTPVASGAWPAVAGPSAAVADPGLSDAAAAAAPAADAPASAQPAPGQQFAAAASDDVEPPLPPEPDYPEPDDLPEPPEPDEGPEPPFEAPLPPSAPEAPQAPIEPPAPSAPKAEAAPAAAPAAATSSSGPSFTRYGEAVVREVLGATFLEELPRDNGTGR